MQSTVTQSQVWNGCTMDFNSIVQDLEFTMKLLKER